MGKEDPCESFVTSLLTTDYCSESGALWPVKEAWNCDQKIDQQYLISCGVEYNGCPVVFAVLGPIIARKFD